MKKYLRLETLTPWVLLIIAWLAYGVFIRSVGLYWDDMPYVFFGHVLGPTQYHLVFYDERPFLPILYNLTAPIFGENITLWQVFAIFMRWVSALCVGWIVRLIWPGKKELAFVVSLLFLVYPGFGQQWISTIYSRVFILLLLFMLSLALMLKAERTPGRHMLFTALALICGTVSLLGSEYYYGLEFSRPAILWIVLTQRGEKIGVSIKRTLLQWLPYLLVLIVFTIWRGMIVESSLYRIRVSGESGILLMLWDLLKNMAGNAFKGGVLAWTQIFTPPENVQWTSRLNLVMGLAAGGALALSAWFAWKFSTRDESEDEKGVIWQSWQTQAMMIGVAMLMAGSLPSWAARLTFDLRFPYNRFTLPMMFGSALILAAGIYLLRSRWLRVALLSLLVALSAGWHFQTANSFRLEWNKLNSFLQQLTWRVPGLQPGTMLVAYELPFNYYSDNSLTAAINWTYAPDFHGGDLPYVLDYLTVRKNSALKVLEPDTPVIQKYRALEFHGNTSDILAIHVPEGGCVRVLDDEYANIVSFPRLNVSMADVIALSNLERIITDPGEPAIPIPQFFPETTEQNWCYFFEKADLVRQTGDYEQVAALWDQAEQAGLTPGDITEYQPFVEGLGLHGRLAEAIQIAREMVAEKKSHRKGLCQIWGRIGDSGSLTESDQFLLAEIIKEFNCVQ
ncbi:MAG: hypothetical protein C0391_02530 [Anaerolinea sp.]|nr:hypothetical protein [Anaerolinea sp.]